MDLHFVSWHGELAFDIHNLYAYNPGSQSIINGYQAQRAVWLHIYSHTQLLSSGLQEELALGGDRQGLCTASATMQLARRLVAGSKVTKVSVMDSW